MRFDRDEKIRPLPFKRPLCKCLMSRVLQWVYICHQHCLGRGFNRPQWYWTDGIRWNCYWAHCVSQLFLSAGVFPGLYWKWDALPSANWSWSQQEQRTVLADVIFLTACPDRPHAPHTYTYTLQCSSPHVMPAATHSLHLEMGNLVCFTVNGVELSSRKSEFVHLCNSVLLMAKAASLLCESHREVSLKGFHVLLQLLFIVCYYKGRNQRCPTCRSILLGECV